MKPLTFDEFLAMPAGTIFGNDYGLPHMNEGLFVKGETSLIALDDDESSWPAFLSTDLTFFDGNGQSSDEEQWVNINTIDDDHRFLAYEPADLDRLAGLIERARGLGRPNGEVG